MEVAAGTRWTEAWTARLLVAVVAAAPVLPALTGGASPVGPAITVIVDGASSDEAAAAVRATGGVVGAPLELIGGVAATVSSAAVTRLVAAADVVILDVMMPGTDGFSVLRSLRASPQTDDIPVVLLSAKASDDEVFAGWRSGADSDVTKPFEVDEILRLVARIAAEA